MNLESQTASALHAELGAIGFKLLDVEDHLTALLGTIPVPEGEGELPAEDLLVDLRGSIECSLADCVRPAIRTLEAASRLVEPS